MVGILSSMPEASGPIILFVLGLCSLITQLDKWRYFKGQRVISASIVSFPEGKITFRKGMSSQTASGGNERTQLPTSETLGSYTA
jgi:hypothetical protein